MPSRPNVDNTNVPLMRTAEIWAGGYPLPLVTAFDHDLVVADDTYPAFGTDQDLYFRTLDGANLTMNCANAREMQALLEVANNLKPDNSVLRAFYPNTKVMLDVIRQFKTDAADGYNIVEFYSRWNTVVRTPQGDPRARGSIQMNGRCEAPIRIVAAAGKRIAIVPKTVTVVNGVVNAAGGVCPSVNGTKVAALDAIPNIPNYRNANKYAFMLEVQNRTGAVLNKYARIPVTTTNVASDGSIAVTASDLLGTDFALSEVNAVHVCVFLNSGTSSRGAQTDWLLGSATGIAYDGRLD